MKHFMVGQPVVMTRKALRQGLQGRAKSNRGEVVAFDPPYRVKVLRDGLRRPDWFHVDFWDRLKGEGEKDG